MKAASYRTYVFDCDGVVLDSNRLKTEAFRQAAEPYGIEAANALVAHHVVNGGISRFAKFQHFLDNLVPEGAEGPDYDELLEAYAAAVQQGLRECAIAPGLEPLRRATRSARWLIVSGGSQIELRDVFAERGIAHWFDGGIFGSPDVKTDILTRELSNGNIEMPAVYIGDSAYDFHAASAVGLDFLFATYWTEVADWERFATANALTTVASLSMIGQHCPRRDTRG